MTTRSLEEYEERIREIKWALDHFLISDQVRFLMLELREIYKATATAWMGIRVTPAVSPRHPDPEAKSFLLILSPFSHDELNERGKGYTQSGGNLLFFEVLEDEQVQLNWITYTPQGPAQHTQLLAVGERLDAPLGFSAEAEVETAKLHSFGNGRFQIGLFATLAEAQSWLYPPRIPMGIMPV